MAEPRKKRPPAKRKAHGDIFVTIELVPRGAVTFKLSGLPAPVARVGEPVPQREGIWIPWEFHNEWASNCLQQSESTH